MKEIEFINKFKSQFSGDVDKSKKMTVLPKQKCSHPFVVELEGIKAGCLYLHYDSLAPSRVWIMYLKSYTNGFGSKILKLLCEQADKEHICLYLEPYPDKGCEFALNDLIAWYKRYGFVGERTMEREPNA